jgi:hypothetical protein
MMLQLFAKPPSQKLKMNGAGCGKREILTGCVMSIEINGQMFMGGKLN